MDDLGGCDRQGFAVRRGSIVMGPEQLAELRNFFAVYEARLPVAVSAMYKQLLEQAPEVRPLFKGDFQEQEKRYLNMLLELVKLTRSRQLWPVQPGQGISSIPTVDKLASSHAGLGLTRAHFERMKTVLIRCFKEDSPELFTPQAENALTFIFDVAARATTELAGASGDELARKNRLPHSGEKVVRTKEQLFWDWFAKEEESLFNFETDQERVFGALAFALANVSPELTFEIGPKADGVREFVISAGGIKAAFSAVETLALVAPPLPRWRVVEFRQRRDPLIPLEFGGKTVDPSSVQFSLLTNGEELGLYLFFDGYDEKEKAVWGQIGYLFLDQALGEYDVETKVGLIEFHRPDAPQDAARYPLRQLPKLFDEKFESMGQPR
jgi:hemoglobin-like flavoprotein